MTTITPRRRGVTLIELLVVMGILALLAALATSAAFRVAAGQKVSATEATLNKLHSLLRQRWSAVVDQCEKDARTGRIPTQLLTYVNNDKDRARVIWTYMRLKNEFPTTQLEATTAVSFGGAPPLQPRQAFSGVPAGGSEEEQSAACLYLILTRTGTSGVTLDTDGLQGQIGDFNIGGTTAPVFKDTWGQPIAFVRMTYSAEVDSRPYAANPSAANKDPIDSRGRLVVFENIMMNPNAWTATKLNDTMPTVSPAGFWPQIVNHHIASGGAPATYPTTNRSNWVPTLISAGPNRQFGAIFGGDDIGDDNIFSFRLNAGLRGD